ncbi:MAG TPA: response regulator [Dongiaceae bacterium]|nr:response regulator [Dongiaceae bacterium]
MSVAQTIKILLIEDDEDDYVIASGLLAEIRGQTYTLDWAKSYDQGLDLLQQNLHDVCLLDYRLGAHTGLELLAEALRHDCQMPIILLTGMGQTEIDVAAMKAGAADYLVKARLEPRQLERAIRYAIERKRAAAQAAFEQARLAAFGSEVGLRLAQRATLADILKDCARSMERYLNCALAQIWIYDPGKQVLEPHAGAGPVFDAAGTPAGIPVPPFNLQELGRGQAVFWPTVINRPEFPHQAWAAREELGSFVAYPLVLEETLVGCVSLFFYGTMTETVLQEVGSVANGIALCIQRKQAEAALSASEHRYRAVVENIKEVIFQVDEFGHWVFLNPAWHTIAGFSLKETLGTLFLDYIHHDDRDNCRYIFLQLVNQKIDFCRFEARLLTQGGKVRWAEVYMQLMFDANGTVEGISGSLNDITERKEAEAEVQKLAAFPRLNPNAVLEFDADGRLTYANEATLRLANSLGKSEALEILPSGVQNIIKECLAQGAKRLREEICFNGRTLTWSFFPVAASRVVHCYGSDITEILNLEAQFRHAQKMESVGQLAAGIAHDFNNILTVIQGYSECLGLVVEDNPDFATPVKQIGEAARRATALTRQLLMFSRKQMVQPRVLDLNCVLQNLAKMQARLMGEDVAQESDYAPDLPKIEADAGMIEQIVMNLAVNARDAMPKGGQLLVTTRAVEIDAEYVRNHPEARPGQFVCLSVRDTGCGIDPKTLGRIFEPFFSTKEVGQGTGLGLATVYGIVKQHQGWIEVTSTVGAGTTFKIYFPASKAGAADAEPNQSPQELRGGTETILLVEDEPALREMVRTILAHHHYNILEAGSGVQALRVWDEYDGKIDLLLTDMVMPEGMNGHELAEQLRQRKPGLRVIYTSGYSPDMIRKNIAANDTVFLAKPYYPPQLVQLVRDCLDKPMGELKSA